MKKAKGKKESGKLRKLHDVVFHHPQVCIIPTAFDDFTSRAVVELRKPKVVVKLRKFGQIGESVVNGLCGAHWKERIRRGKERKGKNQRPLICSKQASALAPLARQERN